MASTFTHVPGIESSGGFDPDPDAAEVNAHHGYLKVRQFILKC